MFKKIYSKLAIGKRLSIACLISVTVFHSLPAIADVSVKNALANNYVRYIQASHFLSQATFGPTVDTVTALASRIKAIGRDAAFNEWIDDQFTRPNISPLDLGMEMLLRDGEESNVSNHASDTLLQNPRYYREHTWWHQAVMGESQLLSRMAWALYQIMPAYSSDNLHGWRSSTSYREVLRNSAFGTHRDLLENITYNPVMASMLSHMKNDKGDESLGIFPDENYAREVMQLFSIGVYDINSGSRFVTDSNGNRVENYTNDDITQLARVFTGLAPLPKRNSQSFFSANGGTNDGRLVMWENHHHQGSKTFLGKTIPAGQSGDQDISDALDILANYKTTPYFFSNLLMQRFTTSTPNVNYLQRVANVFKDNGQGVRGDFKEVIRAILMDSTVRDSLKIVKTVDPDNSARTLITVDVNQDSWENDTTQGRLREPMLQTANFFRFFEADPLEHESSNHGGDFKPFYSDVSGGQRIRDEISIFGYYSADYLPVTGPAANKSRNQRPLVLPEFELLPSSLVVRNEKILSIARRQSVLQRQSIFRENAPLKRLIGYTDDNSFEQLIFDLNVFLFAGTMSKSLQEELLVTLDDISGSTDAERLARAVSVLFASPDFAIIN